MINKPDARIHFKRKPKLTPFLISDFCACMGYALVDTYELLLTEYLTKDNKAMLLRKYNDNILFYREKKRQKAFLNSLELNND